MSHNNISLLKTLVYKDKNKTRQTIIFQKPTDKQSYLHAHLNNLKSLEAKSSASK